MLVFGHSGQTVLLFRLHGAGSQVSGTGDIAALGGEETGRGIICIL